VSDDPRDERDPLELLPDFHRTTRMPLDAVVRLHFEGTVAYQNGFAANVSALGMFVKHPDPPEVGTRLVFEFVLGEERKPVQGAGVVAWVRDRYEGPGRPAGVGIQFTELDALSRQHVSEALFEYLEAQLGVDVADHPDVPDLLAAVPSRAGDSAEIAAERFAPEEDEAPVEELGLPSDWSATEAPDEEEPPPLPSFRPFAETPEVGEEGFAPVVPPDEAAEAPHEMDDAFYGRARETRSGGSGFRIGIAAGVVAAILAGGWWFLFGPGAGAPAPEVGAPAPAAAPEPEPLPATVEDGTTLAEAVGVEGTNAGGAPAPEAEEPEANVVEAPVVETPAAETAEAEAPAATTPAPVTSRPGDAEATPKARVERLVDLAWDSSPGTTFVTLTGDGAFVAGTYRYFEMGGDEPRILVRLTGVSEGYPTPVAEVGTAQLRRVRTGFHQKPAGNELHVVLDLAPGASLQGVDVAGNRLVVRLGSP